MKTCILQFCIAIMVGTCLGCMQRSTAEKSNLDSGKESTAGKANQEERAVRSDGNALNNADGWCLFRGNPESTGVAKGSLPDELEVLWDFKVKNGSFEGTAAIVEVDGELVAYLGDLDGTLFSFDLETGDKRWEFKPESEIGFGASPSYRDGFIYIGDIDGVFYCIDDKGNEVWSLQTDSEISSSANFFKDNVLFGSQDATLYCLDAKTGDEVWKMQADDQIQGTPTVIGGRAFVAGCDAKLHVINLENGQEVGSVEIDSPTGSTVAAVGDSVYFGTEQAGFFAVDWKQPALKWHYQDESVGAIRSNPAVSGHHVVFGAGDRTVRSLDPKTKKENWVRTLKAKTESSPVIVDQRVYIGSGDGRLYALELETGKVCWEKQFEGGITSSPAVAFGRLIIATDRGTVYCLGKGK